MSAALEVMGGMCAQTATVRYMESVASRDLRNHTADVLRRVARGAELAVTVHGEVVAELHPPRDRRPRFFTRADVDRMLLSQADAGLTDDLRELAGDTTDDLDDLDGPS